MPEVMEVFINSTKTRVGIGCMGVLNLFVAAVLLCNPAHVYSQYGWRWVALFFTLIGLHSGVLFLTLGLCGGFPLWSHSITSGSFRAQYARWFKAHAVIPAPTYKWGNSRQILLVQLAMVNLVGWLATLVSPLVALFGRGTWMGGAAVGGLAAIVLKYVLKR